MIGPGRLNMGFEMNIGLVIPPPPLFTQLGTVVTSVGYLAVSASHPDHVFIAANSGNRIVSVNISNPASPTVAHTLIDANLSATQNAAVASGDYLYVAATGTDRISVINISDPTAMVRESTLITSTYLDGVDDIALGYPYLYCATNFYLTVVDVSTPSAPVRVGQIGSNTGHPLRGGVGVSVDGNVLYHTNDYTTAPDFVSRASTVNISTPTSPTLTANVSLPFKPWPGLNRIGSTGFVGDANGTDKVTAINLATPSVISSITDATDLNNAIPLWASFPYVFCAALGTTYDRLTIIDALDPSAMTIAAVRTGADFSNIIDLVVNGEYAYLSSNGKLVVLNANP